MRAGIAAVFAVLLLALMPAFALLRYEHAQATVSHEAIDESASDSEAAGARSESSMPIGPSIWSNFGGHANAASSATMFERSLALAALPQIQDSIPRPAGAPPPRWGDIGSGQDSKGIQWPVTMAELLPACAGVPPDEPCRDRARVTTVSFRLLSNDLERAELLALWTISPIKRRGWFHITLVRAGSVWRVTRIVRAGDSPTEVATG